MGDPPSGEGIHLLAECRVELCTPAAVFKKCWEGIVPSFLNDMFMPSLNDYNTRIQMALDKLLFRTNNGEWVKTKRCSIRNTAHLSCLG